MKTFKEYKAEHDTFTGTDYRVLVAILALTEQGEQKISYEKISKNIISEQKHAISKVHVSRIVRGSLVPKGIVLDTRDHPLRANLRIV